MKNTVCFFACVLLFLPLITANIEEWLKENHQSFYKLLSKSDIKKAYFELPLTLFLPVEDVFKHSSQDLRPDIIRNHIALKNLDRESIAKTSGTDTLARGAPNLFFSKVFNETTKKEELFVNNAKILSYERRGDTDIFVIDELIIIPRYGSIINGLDVLVSLPDGLNLNSNQKAAFQKLNEIIKGDAREKLEKCTKCTFFFPEKITDESKLTPDVLAAHIIDREALFLRTMINNTRYNTLLDGSDFSVSLSRKQVRLGRGTMSDYIEANVNMKNKDIRFGNTRAKVKVANIPVNNGVIHIIEKPLVVVDTTVMEYLKEESEHSLQNFVRLLNTFPELQQVLNSRDAKKPITVFAFSDAAYDSVKSVINSLQKTNTSQLKELMQLHFIPDQVILSNPSEQGKQYVTLSSRNRVQMSYSDSTLYVEGSGVKASVKTADIAATNGVIHIINKVLGIPSSLINDKLEEDPQFETTFTVANNPNVDWISTLANKDTNYTVFAPSQDAWDKLKRNEPSAYKQLVEGLYPDNSKKVLNRHLIIGKAWSLSELEKLQSITTNEKDSELKIERVIKSDQKGLKLKWRQIEATITRHDIKAVNGIIHEIDTVIMESSDLLVSSKEARSSANTVGITTGLLLIFISFGFLLGN